MKAIQLDQEVLQNLYGDCEESKSEVFSEFLAGFTELKQNLFSAYDDANLESLKKLLHFYGPSFMYVGVPNVATCFKNLELKCAAVTNVQMISRDFFELLQMVDDTRTQVINQSIYYSKAV